MIPKKKKAAQQQQKSLRKRILETLGAVINTNQRRQNVMAEVKDMSSNDEEKKKSQKKMLMQDYDIGSRIGKGSYGTIYRASVRAETEAGGTPQHNKEVALKTFPMAVETATIESGRCRHKTEEEEAKKEAVTTMEDVKFGQHSAFAEIVLTSHFSMHPNVVPFFHLVHAPLQNSSAVLAFSMQRATCDLFYFIARPDEACGMLGLSFPDRSDAAVFKAQIIRDLKEAVKFLHSQDYVHGDLRVDNVLMAAAAAEDTTKENNDFGKKKIKIWLCDFSIARHRLNTNHRDYHSFHLGHAVEAIAPHFVSIQKKLFDCFERERGHKGNEGLKTRVLFATEHDIFDAKRNEMWTFGIMCLDIIFNEYLFALRAVEVCFSTSIYLEADFRHRRLAAAAARGASFSQPHQHSSHDTYVVFLYNYIRFIEALPRLLMRDDGGVAAAATPSFFVLNGEDPEKRRNIFYDFVMYNFSELIASQFVQQDYHILQTVCNNCLTIDPRNRNLHFDFLVPSSNDDAAAAEEEAKAKSRLFFPQLEEQRAFRETFYAEHKRTLFKRTFDYLDELCGGADDVIGDSVPRYIVKLTKKNLAFLWYRNEQKLKTQKMFDSRGCVQYVLALCMLYIVLKTHLYVEELTVHKIHLLVDGVLDKESIVHFIVNLFCETEGRLIIN